MNRKQRRELTRLNDKVFSKIDRSVAQGYRVNLQESKVYRYVIDYPTVRKAYARAIIGPMLGWGFTDCLYDDTMFHYIYARWRDVKENIPELAKSYGFVEPETESAEEYCNALITRFASLFGWQYKNVVEDGEWFVSVQLDEDSSAAFQNARKLKDDYIDQSGLLCLGDFGDVGRWIELTMFEHGEWLNRKSLAKRFPENTTYTALGFFEENGVFSRHLAFYPHQITAIYPTKRQLAVR